MRQMLLLLAMSGLALGCSRSAAPPAAPTGLNSWQSGSGAYAQPAWHPPTNMNVPRYQGRTASDWVAELREARTPATRQQASKALEHLKGESTPLLLQLIREHPSTETRLAALEALTLSEVARNDKVMIPLLMELLRDRNPELRREAAARLAWFDRTETDRSVPGPLAQERMWALQAQYYFDSDPSVRLAARNSLLSVYDHMRGTLDCPPVQDILIDPPPRR